MSVRKKVDIKKLIPSKAVRDNMTVDMFTDAELAALICNGYDSLRRQNKLLEELSKETSDRQLADRLRKHLLYEETKLKILKDNRQREYVYVLQVFGDNSGYRPLDGVILDFDGAARYGKTFHEGFFVTKYPVSRKNDIGYLVSKREEMEYDIHYGESGLDWQNAGFAAFSDKGKLEMCMIDKQLMNEEIRSYEACRPEQYVRLCNPFRPGDIVLLYGGKTSKRFGIVRTSKEEWLANDLRYQNLTPDDEEYQYCHCFANEVELDYLWDDGTAGYEKLSPAFLEFADEEKCKDEPTWMLIKAMQAVKYGDGNLKDLLCTYEDTAWDLKRFS